MSAYAETAVVVLAAGQGRRFGSDKLMADIAGRPMGLHVADALAEMSFGWRFAVCSKSATLAQHFSDADFTVIVNDIPEIGQAHSLHLAVQAVEATAASALLVVLADMPFVTASHIDEVLEKGPGIIASTFGKRPMPPALFPRNVWSQLLATTGDAGARDLLRHASLVCASASELRDIDTTDELVSSKV